MSEAMLLNEIPGCNATRYAEIALGPLPEDAVNVPASEPSDDEIIERIRNGDINAFEVLMQRYDRWVRGIVVRRVNNGQAAEIVQEVFIQAYQSLPHYSPRRSLAASGRLVCHSSRSDGGSPGHLNTSFRHWLATIAVRRCCDYWRAENRHSVCAISNLNAEDREQMEQSLQATASEAVQSEMDRARMRETLDRAMERLEADDQIILGLLYWKNYSLEEIAAILGYSPGNIRIRVSRARNALRKLMVPAAITEQSPAPVNVYQAEGMTAVA